MSAVTSQADAGPVQMADTFCEVSTKQGNGIFDKLKVSDHLERFNNIETFQKVVFCWINLRHSESKNELGDIRATGYLNVSF